MAIPSTVYTQQITTTGTLISNTAITTSNIGFSTGTTGYIVNEKPKRKYWYRFIHYECPLCGSIDTIKERVYDKPKPEKVEDRHIDEVIACGYHFC